VGRTTQHAARRALGSVTLQFAVLWTAKDWIETMSDMVKVIEVLAESKTSWEDAAQNAVNEASKTLHGIKSIYIKNFEAQVDNDKITHYRINAKISFLLNKG